MNENNNFDKTNEDLTDNYDCEVVIDSVCCTIGKIDHKLQMTEESVKIVKLAYEDAKAESEGLEDW